jgi:hypothetical protein
MTDLNEEEFRNAMIKGAFYFSYEPKGSDSSSIYYGKAMAPKLDGVKIFENCVQILHENSDIIIWYDENSEIICTDYSIDLSTISSNFVRAVLINDYGKTYTQPFGLKKI